MTKALRKMDKKEQDKAIERRLASKTKGLGYWAAHDARYPKNKKTQKKDEQS